MVKKNLLTELIGTASAAERQLESAQEQVVAIKDVHDQFKGAVKFLSSLSFQCECPPGNERKCMVCRGTRKVQPVAFEVVLPDSDGNQES